MKRSASVSTCETPFRSDCPISLGLDLLGDKWTLLVIRDILIFNKKRYQEFITSPEKISTNILADRLSKLHRLGIITKSDDPSSKKQFIYAPTKKGLDLLPILFDLARWGIKHDPRTDLKHPLMPRFEHDEEKWTTEIRAQFKKRQKNSKHASISDRHREKGA